MTSQSRDVIGDVTNRMPMATFLQAPNMKELVLSFWDIKPEVLWIHDVITDVTTAGEIIYEDPAYIYRRPLC